MIVRIESVRENGGGMHVAVTSMLGDFEGVWRGDLPTLGERYGVELDVRESVGWGSQLTLTEEETGIRKSGSGFVLVGEVVETDDDLVVLDLGGAIVQLRTEGAPPDVLRPALHLRATVQSLTIYDTRM